MSSKTTKIWLDCDPGIDDAFAIILTKFSPNVELIGISNTHGNCPLEKATKNTLNVLNIAGQIKKSAENISLDDESIDLIHYSTHGGLNIPVIKGCHKPIFGRNVFADEIHGESGLEAEFPVTPQHALDFVNKINAKSTHFTTHIYEKFKNSQEKITILAIGPLTNVALLLLNYPSIKNHIEKIVIMGGSSGSGNVTPVAEFNIYCDPVAASIVFDSEVPIYLLPLDCTNHAKITEKDLSDIKKIGTPLSKTLHDLLIFLLRSIKTQFGIEDPPLHDPVAAFFVIDPTAFEYKHIRVDVETAISSQCYGQTVCDFHNRHNKKKNVHICLKVNVDKFWDALKEAIRRASQN